MNKSAVNLPIFGKLKVTGIRISIKNSASFASGHCSLNIFWQSSIRIGSTTNKLPVVNAVISALRDTVITWREVNGVSIDITIGKATKVRKRQAPI